MRSEESNLKLRLSSSNEEREGRRRDKEAAVE